MTRWIKIARAEVLREVTQALRYPIELVTGIVILYVLFFAFYNGVKMLTGAHVLASGQDAAVISFCMWFFALLAMNVMTMDIESEARQGTFEQVYLSCPSFTGLLWMRGGVHVGLGAGAVLVLSVLIQLTTGRWLPITISTLAPTILVVLLTVGGLLGFALMLGGLTLVFKRVGQLSGILQFGLFILAYTDSATLRSPWNVIVAHLPFAGGIHLLKELLAEGGSAASAMAGLPWLALDTAVYAVLGTVIFGLLLNVARRQGSLSHY